MCGKHTSVIHMLPEKKKLGQPRDSEGPHAQASRGVSPVEKKRKKRKEKKKEKKKKKPGARERVGQ